MGNVLVGKQNASLKMILEPGMWSWDRRFDILSKEEIGKDLVLHLSWQGVKGSWGFRDCSAG